MYLSNKDLYCEIIYSKAKGRLSLKAEGMLMLLCKKVISSKFRYYKVEDKEDCMQTAMLDIFKNWANFDEDKTTNAFAFYTEVIKRGAAKGWNEFHKAKGYDIPKTYSIDGMFEGDGGWDMF